MNLKLQKYLQLLGNLLRTFGLQSLLLTTQPHEQDLKGQCKSEGIPMLCTRHSELEMVARWLSDIIFSSLVIPLKSA